MADKPQSFAIMRNAHEAFRMCLKELDEYLHGLPEDRVKFIPVWKDYVRSMFVHMHIEDHDMFKLLDDTSNGEVTKSGILGLHSAEHNIFEQVEHLLPNEDSTEVEWHAFRELFTRWKKVHEDHFVSEEKVMMPLTQKVAATPEARSELLHDRVIVHAKNRNLQDFHFHVAFCVQYLSKYGSTGQDAFGATQVYVRGFKAASTPDEWTYEILPLMKNACEPEVWAKLQDKFDIESTNGVLGSTPPPAPTPAPAAAPAPTPAPAPAPQKSPRTVAPSNQPPGQNPQYYQNQCCTIN